MKINAYIDVGDRFEIKMTDHGFKWPIENPETTVHYNFICLTMSQISMSPNLFYRGEKSWYACKWVSS